MADPSHEFRLVSPHIDHEGRLPRQYTGEGQGAKKNISPPLEWYDPCLASACDLFIIGHVYYSFIRYF